MNKITEAIRFAAKAHDKQLRKLDNHPYIFHITEVGQIVSYMSDDVDTIVAAILHDTVEDTGVSVDEIEKKFGPRVKELVCAETEDKKRDKPAASTWKERKLESLEVLRNSDDIEEKKIWLADKLSNIRSMYIYHIDNGKATFEQFHEKNPKNHKWYYKEIAKILKKDFSKEPIYKEYCRLVDELFKEYK